MRSNLFMVVVLVLTLSTAFSAALATSNATCYVTEKTYGMEDSSPSVSETGNDMHESITVYFFYGSGCPHCAMVEPLIQSLDTKYPQVKLEQLEVFHNSTNQALFQDFNARYGVKNPLVPSVFIGDQALIGEDSIETNLEPNIQRLISIDRNDSTNQTNSTNNPSNGSNANAANNTINPPQDNDTESGSAVPSTDLTIPMVVVAAAADSINPCAISVMIFLLLFLTSLGNRWRVLLVGLVYILTVYMVYFAAGLGILAFLSSMSLTRFIYYGAALLSIVIGTINIKDSIFSKKTTLAISESRKPMIKKYIEKASVPAAIVLGVAVSMFELPCTGGIYFAILTLLGNEMTMSEGLPYLALYNLIYVLPLAVILGVIYMGVSAEKANSWRLEQRRALRFVVGLVMVVLGIVMLLGVL